MAQLSNTNVYGNLEVSGTTTLNNNLTMLAGTLTVPTISATTLGVSGTITATTVTATSLYGTEAYITNWIRTSTSNTGLYSSNTVTHFYSYASGRWTMTAPGQASGALQFRVEHDGVIKGWVYWDSSGFGLLHSGGDWMLRANGNNTVVFPGSIQLTKPAGNCTIESTPNLHLDCTAGNGTYLNYYRGEVVYFGNGAGSGTTASITKAGVMTAVRYSSGQGTVANTGYSFDSDTGMFSTGDGVLKFYSNNVYCGGPATGSNSWDISITGTANAAKYS